MDGMKVPEILIILTWALDGMAGPKKANDKIVIIYSSSFDAPRYKSVKCLDILFEF